MMIKFLKNKKNGRIFPYEPVLAKNPKFYPCTEEGVEVSGTIKADDLSSVVAKKDKESRLLKDEISMLQVYIKELEGQIAGKTNDRDVREAQLSSFTRKNLVDAAGIAGISYPAQKYRVGKEKDLVADILEIEFPTA